MNSYYYSWMAQKNAVDFPVAAAEHDEFILNSGNRVYDFVCTSFQANFGHNHPQIVDRMIEQLRTMPIASPKSTFDLKQTVSERLNSVIGLGAGKIFYTVSGSESVENALKIARQITGRKIVLARQNSYHGASMGALSVTGDWRNDAHLTFDEGTVRIPDHDVDDSLAKIEAIIAEHGADRIAAVILETIGGTNGMSAPPVEWILGIQAMCRQHNMMFILDEVLVGFGRCGPMFAFHDFSATPDMVCMSKGITGGYMPFGAVWTSPEIAKHYEDEVLCCGLTNYGHPLGLAATDAVLDILDDADFIARKQALEVAFAEALKPLADRSDVEEVRIRGVMAGIFFNRPAPSWQAGFDAGLHLFSKQNFTILAPPFVSTPERLNQAVETFITLLD